MVKMKGRIVCNAPHIPLAAEDRAASADEAAAAAEEAAASAEEAAMTREEGAFAGAVFLGELAAAVTNVPVAAAVDSELDDFSTVNCWDWARMAPGWLEFSRLIW